MFPRLVVLAVLTFALPSASFAHLPSERTADQVWLTYLKAQCGDSRLWMCANASVEGGCGTPADEHTLSCHGFYEEKRLLDKKRRGCFLYGVVRHDDRVTRVRRHCR